MSQVRAAGRPSVEPSVGMWVEAQPGLNLGKLVGAPSELR